ncbi:MAG: FAD-dependent thymidylate synthase [Conexivisphaerales archaeon]
MRVNLLWYTDIKTVEAYLTNKGLPVDYSCLEDHVFYMFEIEDVSRVTTHQLIRHRGASYDQESQRFSAASKESFVVPTSIASKNEAYEIYRNTLQFCANAFEKLVSLGVPKEDARYIMPHAIKTKLVMTVNAKNLKHIVGLRTAPQAQWEIRELVSRMREAATRATPEVWVSKEF